jgi:hypothetical protein
LVSHAAYLGHHMATPKKNAAMPNPSSISFTRLTTVTLVLFPGRRRRANCSSHHWAESKSSPSLHPLITARHHPLRVVSPCRLSASCQPKPPLSFDLVIREVSREHCDLQHANEHSTAAMTSGTPMSNMKASWKHDVIVTSRTPMSTSKQLFVCDVKINYHRCFIYFIFTWDELDVICICFLYVCNYGEETSLSALFYNI